MLDVKKYQEELENIKDITHKEREKVFNIPGVVGTGLTLSNVTCIDNKSIDNKNQHQIEHQVVVFLKKNCQKITSKIPEYIDDIRVVNIPSGKCHTTAGAQYPRIRPIKGGAGIYSYRQKWIGSIGGFPIDTTDGEKVLLSANHVMALDWGCLHSGQVGDAILQPPLYADGTFNDTVARLKRWVRVYGITETSNGVPIENLVDCAISKIEVPYDDINLYNYQIDGWIDPIPGTFVKKAGAGTLGKAMNTDYPYYQYPNSYIYSVDTKITMDLGGEYYYGGPFFVRHGAIFKDQIIVAGLETFPFVAQQMGDSGSIVVHYDTNNAIGLLIGGTWTGPVGNGGGGTIDLPDGKCTNYYADIPAGFGVVNKIEHVQNLLGISFGNKYNAPAPQVSHKKCVIDYDTPLCYLIRGEGQDECAISASTGHSNAATDTICENKRVSLTIRINIVPPSTQDSPIQITVSHKPPGFYLDVMPRCWCWGTCTFNNFEIGSGARFDIANATVLPHYIFDKLCYDGNCITDQNQAEYLIFEKNQYILDFYFKPE